MAARPARGYFHSALASCSEEVTMQPGRALRVLIACTLLWASQALHAAPCTQSPSSFNDVEITDIFCTDVQWLKNRGVTLGCGDGTVYCPDDAVTRASMALFMKRLAEKIVPEPALLTETISNRTLTVFPLENQFCLVNVPDADYPRAFSITGSVHIANPTSSGLISAAVRREDNGGPVTAIEQVNATITSGVDLFIPIVMLDKLGPGPKSFRVTLHTAAPPVAVAIAICTLRIEARSL